MAPDHFFGECVSDLLNTATSACAFGESVKYIPLKTGSSFTISAIFDGPFEQVDPDTEVVVASNQFTIGVKLSDLQFAPVKGDKVEIREILYRVIDSQEDGQGGSEIMLHKVC